MERMDACTRQLVLLLADELHDLVDLAGDDERAAHDDGGHQEAAGVPPQLRLRFFACAFEWGRLRAFVAGRCEQYPPATPKEGLHTQRIRAFGPQRQRSRKLKRRGGR